MSVETSRTSPPGDGDSEDEQTFGYRSADSAAVDDDLDDDDLDDDDLDDDAVVSRDNEDDLDGDTVVQGTVYDSSAADSDAVVTDVDDPRPTFTPVDDREQLVADLSVNHGKYLDGYRGAIRATDQAADGSTEEFRQALLDYRTLFNDLIGAPAADGARSRLSRRDQAAVEQSS